MLAADEVLLAHDAFDFIGQGNERVTGKKSRGPQVARGSKLKVADCFFFFLQMYFLSLFYTKLEEVSFNSVLRTPGSALH